MFSNGWQGSSGSIQAESPRRVVAKGVREGVTAA